MKGAKYPYRISFDLPEKLYRKLHIARLDCGKRKKEIIIEALRDWFSKNENANPYR